MKISWSDLNHQWLDFCALVKNHFLSNKKTIIINLLIFFFLGLASLLFDQLTKNNIFPHEEFLKRINNDITPWEKGKTLFNYGIIGLRPVFHHGVTSGINKLVGFVGIHVFSFIVLIGSLFALFITKKWYFGVFFTFLISGDLGNMIDRFSFDNHVKDVFFIPYHDRGTFNAADVYVIIAIAGIAVMVLAQLIFDYLNKRNNSNNIDDTGIIYIGNSSNPIDNNKESNKKDSKPNDHSNVIDTSNKNQNQT